MHTLLKHHSDYYTVGYYAPVFVDINGKWITQTKWIPLKDFKSWDEAIKLVNYLNGGNDQ